MRIIVFETDILLDQFVGEHLISFINSHHKATIGFATGSTPLGTYDYLIKAFNENKVDFSNVYAFNLDEYVGIAQNHPKSFYKFMKDYLFDKINIPISHIDALNGANTNMEEECERYDRAIDSRPINIQLLGIGMDGHIAYNEPGSPLDGGCHVVDLMDESIESSLDYGFDHINDVPRQGVTQGVGTIMKAKQLIMMAKGDKKARLVERMLHGPITSDFPSSIIQQHLNVIVVLDQNAAKYIKEEDYEIRS